MPSGLYINLKYGEINNSWMTRRKPSNIPDSSAHKLRRVQIVDRSLSSIHRCKFSEPMTKGFSGRVAANFNVQHPSVRFKEAHHVRLGAKERNISYEK